MGAAASVPTTEDFQSKLAELWEDENNRKLICEELSIAQKFVGKKKREASISVIPHPMSQDDRESLWSKVDYNGNGFLSLAEVDKLIVEGFPEYDNKPAIMRAYHATDRNRNGYISKQEFARFFEFLDYFNKLWEKFEGVDEDGDRRIDFEELKKYSKEIFNKDLSESTARAMFHMLDRNNGGKVLFYEFAAHFAHLEKQFTVAQLPFE